ncbi:MAG: MFS transporter [Candidatus Competibacteraceae bacterium]
MTYAVIVPSLLFAVYFTTVVAAERPDAITLWGVVAALSLLVCGLLAPLAGAYADAKHARLSLLTGFTLLCCMATALLSWPGRGDIALAAVLFIASRVGYTVAMSLYDAYVERLAPLAGGAEWLSSLGWALGFLGGIAAILLVMPLAHGEPAPGDTPLYGRAFPLIALLFWALAVPALFGLRRVPPPAAPPAAALHPWRRVVTTLRRWRAHRTVMRFLLGSYLINDAVVTVGVFTAIYLREVFGVTVSDLLWLALLYHLIALPATALFGLLAHRTSAHLALGATLALWAAAIVVMAFGHGHAAATLVVTLLATVVGSTQALLRGMYARLVPPAQAAEFFGFNVLTGRLSAALGPLLFSAVNTAAGTPKAGLLSLIAFLTAGALILSGVRLPDSVRSG